MVKRFSFLRSERKNDSTSTKIAYNVSVITVKYDNANTVRKLILNTAVYILITKSIK